MHYIINGFKDAIKIIFCFDREFISIVSVSLKISCMSTLLAALFGVPFGIWVGTGKFRGKKLLEIILNTLMSLPTVVIGLVLYSFLSRRGPLGNLGILFTPTAMVVGQFVLAFPIIGAISKEGIKSLGNSPIIAARVLGAGKLESYLLFFRESRFVIVASVMAGFGRVFSEVGVSMMLGGNIRFYTRNITTAIALETSKGAFSLGIALGIVLLIIAFCVNSIVYYFHSQKHDFIS